MIRDMNISGRAGYNKAMRTEGMNMMKGILIKKKISIKRKVLNFVLATISILALAFVLYTLDDYDADSKIKEYILSQPNIEINRNITAIKSTAPSDIGFIFYPGGKVEGASYLSLLYELSQNGVNCILVDMPFKLAVFDSRAADDIYDKFPEIRTWYIGGHSLGGAMASDYYSKNMDKIEGLVLLGAYAYGNVPLEKTITIFGTEDKILDTAKITSDKNLFRIEGGNHAQFGNYGIQKHDGIATITSDQQQSLTVELILKFMEENH